MADIELVIKMDEETYRDIKKGKVYSSIRDVPQESVLAIANGTPLPKGHGELIDRKEVMKNMEFEKDGYCDFDCYKPITDAQTIIEADKTESEANNG